MAIQPNSSYNRRKHIIQQTAFGCFRLLSYGVAALLFFILGFIIVKGIGVINWEFLSQAPSDGMTKGGIWPAIFGTCCLMAGSALFAFPTGVMSGIYMNEYAKDGKLVRFIRMMTNNLSGIPSIVFGLFGMAFFVNWLDFGDSILAGSLTLGLLALPIVIRTTEEAFKDLPDSFREGSLALGATKAQTIWNVLLPMAMPVTGPRFRRNSTDPFYLCRLLSAETARQYLRPVYGSPLPPLRGGNQRNGHRSTDAHCLRNRFRADSDRTADEPGSQQHPEVL